MSSAICGGGIISWSKFIKQKPDEINLMTRVRKRVKYRGHYRYKIIDLLGDCWYWEKQKG
jgi:hypothetical protein